MSRLRVGTHILHKVDLWFQTPGVNDKAAGAGLFRSDLADILSGQYQPQSRVTQALKNWIAVVGMGLEQADNSLLKGSSLLAVASGIVL